MGGFFIRGSLPILCFKRNGVGIDMKENKSVRAKQLVNDFISFFENEYGIRHDAEGDLSLGEKAEEQIIYNWDGSVLSDLSKKEGE